MRSRTVRRSLVLGAVLCSANYFLVDAFAADVTSALATASVPLTQNAAPPDASPDLLARVRAANQELYSNLQFFVCNERIRRFETVTAGAAHHIDTWTARVSFENGTEHYTQIRQDKQPRTTLASIAGAWSEGEFGTLLQQTQILMNTPGVVFKGYTELNGVPVAIYVVEIAAQYSPWDLEVERRHYRIPFRTETWVSRSTGQILKIERVSTELPTLVGIAEMRWSVTLESLALDQKSWLLPKAGSYAVVYKTTGRREWNELTFSEYHRYGSEVALRFQ